MASNMKNLVFMVVASCVSASVAFATNWPSLDYSPPEGWNGPVFKLSQDYPPSLPAPEPPSVAKWVSIDPRTNSKGYLQAVLDYCYDGLEQVDFVPQSSHGRKWFHVPFM